MHDLPGRARITAPALAVSKPPPQLRRSDESRVTLAGYYVLECADLDEALKHAARLPMAPWSTIEVRPVMRPDEWLDTARRAGVAAVVADVTHCMPMS